MPDDGVAVRDIAREFGFRTKSEDDGKRVELSRGAVMLSLEADKAEFRLNGVRVHTAYAIAMHDKRLLLHRRDLEELLQPILTPGAMDEPPSIPNLIVVDPGHGGKDPGAVYFGREEKHYCLSLGLKLNDILRARGYQVLLTRATDTQLELQERSEIANRAGADLFISLHFNASTNPFASGPETYFLRPGTDSGHSSPATAKWNAVLGYFVQRELVNGQNATDRGLKRAGFAVLRHIEMPGLLVEAAFMSEKTEAALLDDPATLHRMATAIADGIDAWKRTIERRHAALAPAPD